MLRTGIVFFILVGVLAAIIRIFWYQEMQYLLPTPVPEDYRVVLPNEVIEYDSILIPRQYSKPRLLHFFNPDCPCSRFNLKHFHALQKKYAHQIDFYVVVASQKKVPAAKKLLPEGGITILVDADERLAKACGIYSTPQAALIQTTNRLYFRGNYNRSRYCTDPASNFVQMAMDSLLNQKGPPHFSELATHSYGCSIPKKEDTFEPL